MINNIGNRTFLLTLFFTVIVLAPIDTWSQVRKYAKVKKVKREIFNYAEESQKPEKLKKNKNVKVVFSDRSNNQSYFDPFSQLKHDKQKILTPYYVIKSNDDSYKLVVADPSALGKPKGILAPVMSSKYRFKDSKSLTFVGWVAKNSLLHYDHSFLSPKNNKPLKYRIGVTDFKRLFNLNKFYNKDTLYCYNDPFLKNRLDKVFISNQIVYPYKYDQTRRSVLVSDKPIVSDTTQQIFGWIPADLITLVGQNEIYRTQEEDRQLVFTGKKDTLYSRVNHTTNTSSVSYKDPSRKTLSDKTFAPNQVVYLYKYNHKYQSILISDKSASESDSTQKTYVWAPADLIKLVGQNHIYKTTENNTHTTTEETKKIKADTFSVEKHNFYSDFLFTALPNTKMATNHIPDSLIIPLYVWDHTKNKLINVKGNDIFTTEIYRMMGESKKTNFHFIFPENSKSDINKMINSLQGIWISISSFVSDIKQYSFTATCLGNHSYYLPPTTSFPEWLDYIQNVTTTPENFSASASSSLEEYIRLSLNKCGIDKNFENNLFIIVGNNEKYQISEEVRELMAQKSSKLLLIQLNNNTSPEYQNYLLETKELLDESSKAYDEYIANYIADNKLIAKEGTMTNIASAKDNMYVYDAPAKSLYNGGLIFPQVGNFISAESLGIAVDSVLAKSFATNKMLINSLLDYESKLGLLRSQPTETLEELYKEDRLSDSLKLSYVNRNSMHDVFYKTLYMSDSTLAPTLEKGYLLSKEELNDLIDNYHNLLPYYTNGFTKKEQRMLKRAYKRKVKGINDNFKRKVLTKKMSIANLYYYQTGFPVYEESLQKISIKKIMREQRHSGCVKPLYYLLARKIIDFENKFLNNQLETIRIPNGEYYFIPLDILL